MIYISIQHNNPLFTRVLLSPVDTLLAHHITTPMELAVALIHLINLMGIVTSATTQQVTSLHPLRLVPITRPSKGAQRSLTQVFITIVRRRSNINQLQSLRRLHLL